MDDQRLLGAGGAVPGAEAGDAAGGVVGAVFADFAGSEGDVAVAQAPELLVDVQQGRGIGFLGLDRDVGGEHRIVNLVAECGVRDASAAGPFHRRADVFIAAALRAPVAELLALVDERLAGGGEQHGGRQFLLVQILAQFAGGAVLVVVGHLDCVDEIAALRLEEVAVADDRGGEVAALAVPDPVAQRPPVPEVEMGRQALVVGRHVIDRIRPGLADHVDVALPAAGLVGGVAAVVPLLQEGDVGGGPFLVDPDDGVEPQAVYAHVDPLVRARGERLEAGVRGSRGIGTVVEVRHALVETGEIAVAAVVEGDVARAVAALEPERRIERDVACAGRGAPFVVAPGILVVLDEEAPARRHVVGDLIDAGRFLIQPHGAVAADPQPHRRVRVGGLRGVCGLADRDRLVGSGPVHGEVQAPVVAGDGVPAAHPAVVLAAAVIVDPACRGIRRRVGGDDVPVLVRAAGGVAEHIQEPRRAVAAVVEDIVHVDVDALALGAADQRLEVGVGAQVAVDLGVVVDVVAVVGRGALDGGEPEGGGAQAVEVVQVVRDALEVAPAVASLAVCEGIDQQLIGDVRPLHAVPGLGRGGQGRGGRLDGILLAGRLRDAHGRTEASFAGEGEGGRTRLGRGIGGRRDADGPVAVAAVGVRAAPAAAGGDGHGPAAVAPDSQGQGSGFGRGEGQRLGGYAQGAFFRLRRRHGVAAGGQDQQQGKQEV